MDLLLTNICRYINHQLFVIYLGFINCWMSNLQLVTCRGSGQIVFGTSHPHSYPAGLSTVDWQSLLYVDLLLQSQEPVIDIIEPKLTISYQSL